MQKNTANHRLTIISYCAVSGIFRKGQGRDQLDLIANIDIKLNA